MAVSEADAEIGAGTAEMQRGIALLIEALGARVQVCVVLFPCRDGIGLIRARRGEDCFPEARERFVLRQIGEHGGGPRRRGAGADGPIDLVARDQLERGTIRFRGGAIHAAHLFGILFREQRRIVACNREARGAAAVGRGHPFVKPRRRGIEARVGTVAEAVERGLLVGQQRRDERRARLIRMLRDQPRQRDGVERGGHHHLLSGSDSQPHAHGDFGEAIEILFEFGCLRETTFGKGGGGGHR